MRLNMRLRTHNLLKIAAIAVCASVLDGQALLQTTPQEPSQPAPKNDSAYVLGPDDRITITALHVDEISGKPIQVDNTGTVNLPMVGRVMVGGLTVPEAETAIAASLKTYIEKPLVTVNVTEYL